MIVEVRTYRIKPGRRAEFIRLFETRAVPGMRAYGMHVLGPLLDVENPHRFVFLRSFPSLEERERDRHAADRELRRHAVRDVARLPARDPALSRRRRSPRGTTSI